MCRCCFLYFVLHWVSFIPSLLTFWAPCAVKRRPNLKSRYKQCIEVAIEYTKSIDDFNDLVNPRTLAMYCLGPEPSAYVLRTIEREEKKSKYLVRHYHPLLLLFFFFFNKYFFLFFFFFFLVGMTMNFNQDMYAKMRSKKNEPLSNLGKRTVRVTGKCPLRLHLPSSVQLFPAPRRRGWLLLPLQLKIHTPISKKSRLTDKEKADSRPFSI